MAVSKETIQDVAECAETCVAPDGKEWRVIGLKAVASVTQTRAVSAARVEIAALEQGIIPRRYLRNMGTIGPDGQIKLLRSAVAVVGAGGLGGTTIELLARQGIGHIAIIDGDRFAEEDLNRQLMSTEDDLGEYKAIIAGRRVKEINSAIAVTTFVRRLTKRNARQLLKDAKVVVDGLDNLSSRFAVEETCRDLRIPFVYGTIAGFSGQLMTIFPEDVGLSSIYGPARGLPEQGIERGTGNPSATPAMVAAWQVQEVVKVITGVGRPLRNHILMLDGVEGVVNEIELSR